MDKRINYAEIIASVMLFGSGLLSLARGVFWIFENQESVQDSALYTALNHAMPIWAWGVMFAVSGLMVIGASWHMPRRITGKSFAWLLLVGGLSSSVAYFIIAIAGFDSASNWMTPLQYITLSGMNGFLAFIGGVRVWAAKDTY
ncbi:hypothetical protein [Salinicoccus sp. Marseille-QA3877]